MITLSRLREGLNLPPEQDAKLERIRSALIRRWETETKRKWNAREDYVETLQPDTRQCDTVFLDLWPVTAITTVEIRDIDCIPASDWTELETDDYLLIGDRQLRRLDQRWWPSLVRVTYDGGVTEADEDIQDVLILQGRFSLTRHAPDKIAVKSQNFEGGGGVFEIASLHPDFAALAKSKVRKA